MKSKLSLLLISLVMTGCAWFQPEVVVQTKLSYVVITCPAYPAPPAVNMLPVKPRAVENTDGTYWVGLTPQDYANLGINFQEVIRYMKAQKGQTNYYRDCILDFNHEIERLQSLESSQHE
jgi:hypothetical protein